MGEFGGWSKQYILPQLIYFFQGSSYATFQLNIDSLNPLIHSKDLYSQFVQISALQNERLLECSAEHTKAPLWDINLAYLYLVAIYSERATNLLRFSLSSAIKRSKYSSVLSRWSNKLHVVDWLALFSPNRLCVIHLRKCVKNHVSFRKNRKEWYQL